MRLEWRLSRLKNAICAQAASQTGLMSTQKSQEAVFAMVMPLGTSINMTKQSGETRA